MKNLFILEAKTNDELTLEIFNRYWQLNDDGKFSEKVPDLAKEYGLSSYELRKKINKDCYCFSTIFECSRCEKAKRYLSRSALKQDQRTIKYVTPNWDSSDKPFLKNVIDQELCNKCKKNEIIERKIREVKLRKEKKELIKKHYQVQEKPILDPKKIDLQDAIYIIALLREGSNENFNKIRPINSFENKLAPTKELTISIINTLFYKKFISIHPDSNLNAFQFVNGSISQHDTFSVSWEPTFKVDENSIADKIMYLEKVLANSEWPEFWWDQIEPFWQEIAYAEVFEFLIYWLNRHHIPYNPGEKTYKVITSLQDDFSTAEINFMIWAKMKDTTSFLTRENVHKQVATNYLLSCVESYADSAKSNGWRLIDFDRSYACPISVVADILYNKVLKLDGFKTQPKI